MQSQLLHYFFASVSASLQFTRKPRGVLNVVVLTCMLLCALGPAEQALYVVQTQHAKHYASSARDWLQLESRGRLDIYILFMSFNMTNYKESC